VKEVIFEKDIRKVLKRLESEVRLKLLRKAATQATAPTIAKLRDAWIRHPRGNGGTLGDNIAAAQRRKTTVSETGVTVKIGTSYRKKNKAKLWHIAERGFTHYGKNGGQTYRRFSTKATRSYEASRVAFMRDAWKQLRAAGLTRGQSRQAYGQIGRAFDARHADTAREAGRLWHGKREARANARALPSGRKKRIPGEMISDRISATERQDLPKRFVEKLRKGLRRAKLG